MIDWIFGRKSIKSSNDIIKFKKSVIEDWTTRAEYYHCNWVMANTGPFMATSHLVRALKIEPNDIVLDLACGTGAVSQEISHHLSSMGMLAGVDISRAALSIAQSWVQSPLNCSFLEMDAENLGFQNNTFDKIACQYALMFFPDPKKTLREIRDSMKRSGKLGVAVHGRLEAVPYFSNITIPMSKFIADFPSELLSFVHRFGKSEDLRCILADGGFSSITIERHVFEYKASSFEDYWTDFFSNGYGNPLYQLLSGRKKETISNIRSDAKKLASQYVKNDILRFPWEVLIATATL